MAADGYLNFDTKINTAGFSKALGSLGGVATKALAGVAAAAGAGTAAFAALTKSALDNVSSYEQLVGGVETLFGAGGASLEEYAASIGQSVEEASGAYAMLEEAQSLVLENANNAYQTAGMSANEYMETVTSFAASLKQSTSDEVEAAKAADQAVQDMADNANKMGTSMESIQNAYQGFSKQNYTMLDNLKLGYGGTKEEMERLLSDAEKLHEEATGEATSYSIDNLADVYNAIHDVQDSLGITGTTAAEAATTIEGSANAAKAAWENFLTGTGSVNDLVNSVSTYAQNVVKNLGEIIPRLAEGLPDLFSQLGALVPDLISGLIQPVTEGATALINGLVGVLPELIDGLLPTLLSSVASIAGTLVSELPNLLGSIASVGLDIMEQIADGIEAFDFGEAADLITDGIADIISSDGIDTFLSTAVDIITGLADGIAEALPELLPAVLELLVYMGEKLIENIPKLIPAVLKVVSGLASAIINSLPVIWNAILTLIGYFGQIPGLIGQKLTEVLTKFSEWALSMVEWIALNVPIWISNIVSFFAGLPEQIAVAVGYVIGTLISWGINVVSWIATNVPAWITSIVTFFAELPGKIWTWLIATANKLIVWKTELVSKGTAAAQGLFNAVVDGIKGLPDRMMEIGGDIVTGIWNGISNGWSWLKDKVASLASSLLDSAKEALGIGSPSKAFRDEVGRWLLPGVELGMEASLPTTLRTMRESARALLDEMQGESLRYQGNIAFSAGAALSGSALNGRGTTVYYDNSVEQTNTYNVPTATPSEVAKTQREALRNMVGGVK